MYQHKVVKIVSPDGIIPLTQIFEEVADDLSSQGFEYVDNIRDNYYLFRKLVSE